MRKQVWILAAMLLMLFPARVFAQETTSSVTVQGRGCVTVTPDLGTISFAVTQEDEEAGQVQKAITEQANKVKDAVLETGLAEDQFSTSGIQLYTNYDYSSGEETAVGYRGQISMMIHEISVDEIGMGKTISRNFEMDTFDEAAMDTGSGLDYSAGTTQVEAVVTVCYEVTRQ